MKENDGKRLQTEDGYSSMYSNKNKKAREIFGRPSEVDKTCSSGALGSRFKPLTISTNTAVIPFMPQGPPEAIGALTSDICEN